MREVRIYPSNLTQTYKGGNLVPTHFLREKPWGRGCKGGEGEGGRENRLGGSARENQPTQEQATRGARVAFPRVG